MKVEGWRYYNHAAIPTVAPHEDVDVTPIRDGSIWRIDGGKPLLARWTSDFDCGYETGWWYTIKDTPFDINALKSKRRYIIKSGIKNFEVRIIDPVQYVDELYEVCIAAFSSWPERYRPSLSRESAKEGFQRLSDDPSMRCYGAFFRENGSLCGFMQVPVNESYVSLSVQRVKPEYEKYQINAALVHHLLTSTQKLEKGNYYILDGERNINHETNFQEYLEKYFGFRKAYCKLHIAYHPQIKKIIKLIYPFHSFLQKFDGIGLIHQINAVLKMEAIVRSEK